MILSDKKIGLLLFGTFILLGVVIFYSESPTTKKAIKTEYSNINYDYHSNDPCISKPKEFRSDKKSEPKNISIYFDVKALDDNYGNVFQTADDPLTIRLELSHPNTLSLIAGNDKAAVNIYKITDKFELNVWHKVEVNVNEDKKIEVDIDGQNMLSVVDKSIMYNTSDIAVGSGYNKLRGFQGEIKNFHINYERYQRVFILELITILTNILLVISALLLFYKLLVCNDDEGLYVLLQSQHPVPAQYLEAQRKRIRIIGLLVGVGFSLSFCHYLVLSYFGFHENVFDYLLSPNGLFDDFTQVSSYVHDNNPYALKAGFASQFPFLYRLASIFAVLPGSLSIFLYLLIFFIFFIIYCWGNIPFSDNATIIKNVFIFSFLTYPFLFCLNRGNYELILFIFLAIFIYLYEEGRVYKSIPFLSMAIALKLFPAIFIILLLSDRKYKAVFYTLLLAFLIMVASYASFKGGILVNLKLHMSNLQLYNEDYAIGNGGLGYCNSAFCGMKAIVAYFHPESFHAFVKLFFKLYTWSTLLFFTLISAYMFIEKKYWKKVTLLVFCMNILPHVSADYKLIHVFIPLFLFINKTETDNHDLSFIVIFSLMLISKSYYYFQFEPSLQIVPYVVNIAVILNPIIMGIGVFTIVFSGLGTWYYTRQARSLCQQEKKIVKGV